MGKKKKYKVPLYSLGLAIALISCFSAATAARSAAAVLAEDEITEHWAEPEMSEALESGYIQGYEDGTFRPDTAISRAEFLKSLLVALGYKLTDSDTPFMDDKGWFRASIATGLKQSLIQLGEYKDKQFDPNRSITREEIARMTVRALGKDREGSESGYMEVAKQLSVISGYAGGGMGGERQASRAEAAVIISRILNKQAGGTLVSYKSASQLDAMIKKLEHFQGNTTIGASVVLINLNGSPLAADHTISVQYNEQLKATSITVYASGAAEKALIHNLLRIYFPDSYDTVYSRFVQAEGQMTFSIDGRSFQINRTSQVIQMNIGD